MISRRAWRFRRCRPCSPAAPAYAQNFPAGQVRIVVPFPARRRDRRARPRAGDAPAGAVGPDRSISDYRPGAAGLIGTRQVIGAPADGHTLLMASTGAILALASGQTAQTGGQAGAFDVTRELARSR